MAKLHLASEGGGSTSHDLLEATITIGRSPDNLIHLEDPSVSGRHAQLQLVGETYELRDLESTNGTKVNGRAIQSVSLRGGDRIRFGKVETWFEAEVPGEAQPLPAMPAVEARAAETSARPADFANASPFPKRSTTKDPVRLGILAAAGCALLAFLASMIALLFMQPPTL